MSLENEPELHFKGRIKVPIMERLHLGRIAVTSGVIETAGLGATLVTGESAYVEMATLTNGVAIGTALHNAHNHFVNGAPKNHPSISAELRQSQQLPV